MITLAVECAAKSASCAVMQNGELLGFSFLKNGLTHSETLMPMVDGMLKNLKLNLSNIDSFAVSAGPGSFTGVRIGIAAVKGMASPHNTPCVPVSTLEAMAYSHTERNGIIAAVMDARCNQVYCGIFECRNGKITRLKEDRALMCEELALELKKEYNVKDVLIVGDGATVFAPYLSGAAIASNENLLANAVGVALCSAHINPVKPEELLPVYLRLPQAERELKKGENK